jgi:hypothetical protein
MGADPDIDPVLLKPCVRGGTRVDLGGSAVAVIEAYLATLGIR